MKSRHRLGFLRNLVVGILLQGAASKPLPLAAFLSHHPNRPIFDTSEYHGRSELFSVPSPLTKRHVVVLSAHPDDATSSSNNDGIRLNKVFKATHSRREADALIESGRVSVNGNPVREKGGFRVQPFQDEVALDGILVEGWEAMNGLAAGSTSTSIQDDKSVSKTVIAPTTTHRTIANNKNKSVVATENFEYIKYWKPRGITCTTDRSIRSNIIDDLVQERGYQPKHRVYPVGRLDKDTSGLILLTSDGRLPNSALRGKFKQPKVYQVLVNRPIHQDDLQQLRNGVVITTTAQRDGKNRGKSLTAPTLPCPVERLSGTRERGVTITLVEGRNRQIRKMMQALGYEVVELHRIQFMGITLEPLQEAGEWRGLDDGEMMLVENVLHQATTEAVEEPQ